jgi:predicted DNA binding CopG/RHH family protein
MTKSQLNIKISKDLLIRIKRQAMMSGKSLTEHITDLVTNSLCDDVIQNTELCSIERIKDLEVRLSSLESIISNREYLSQKLKPFTNSEAINCTKFMRGVFEKELEKRNFDNKSEAFNDLLLSIQVYDELKKSFSDRLKEIMLSDKPSPWTGEELNELTGKDKCNCSIRKGLINWTGKTDCPSQQEICDKGEELVPLF